MSILKIKESEDLDENMLKIKEGLKINYMQMRDGETGTLLWDCKEWNLKSFSHTTKITKELLKCKVVTRNINFTSEKEIKNLELIQNFYLMGELLEASKFKFGYVIPGSTNNWEQIIEAKEDGVLPAEILSGKLTVETYFICQGKILWKNKILIYYV